MRLNKDMIDTYVFGYTSKKIKNVLHFVSLFPDKTKYVN